MCDMHKSVLNSAVRIKTQTDSYVGAGQGQAAAPIMKCKKPHPGQHTVIKYKPDLSVFTVLCSVICLKSPAASVSGPPCRVELQTILREDYAKFYTHREEPFSWLSHLSHF